MSRIVLLLMLGLLACSSLPAATYYVDAQEGNDANNGTSPATAWRSISKVNSFHFVPGDHILLRRGSLWREQINLAASGEENKQIIIDSYGAGPLPTISGADAVRAGSWERCATCRSPAWQAPEPPPPNIVIFGGARGNKKSSSDDLTTALDWYWGGGVLYIYSDGPPSSVYGNGGVEAGVRPMGVNLTGLAYVTIQNIRISGANAAPYATGAGVWAATPGLRGPAPHHLNISHNVVVNCAGDGIHLEGVQQSLIDSNLVAYSENVGIQLYGGLEAFPITAVRIANNEVHHNRYIGISTFGCPAGTSCRASSPPEKQLQVANVTITGNTAYANGAGIYLHQTVNSLVSNNLSYANNDSSRKGEGYCVGLSGSSNNIVERNECYQATHAGIELSVDTSKPAVGSSNNIVRYNIVHDNGTSGLMTDYRPSQNNGFFYNVVYNHRNGSCIFANNKGHKFFNNTCFNNVNGIYLYVTKTTPETGEITIKNNIFMNTSRFHVVIERGVQGPITLDNNAYFPDNPQKFDWQNVLSDFSAWKANTGQDKSSLIADPRFVSPSPAVPHEFALRPDSPAIGRGANLGSDFEDSLGPDLKWPQAIKTVKQNQQHWDLGAIRHKS